MEFYLLAEVSAQELLTFLVLFCKPVCKPWGPSGSYMSGPIAIYLHMEITVITPSSTEIAGARTHGSGQWS